MPQIFRFNSYILYFWSNEGEPVEPIHVHVSVKTPSKTSTKIWITKELKAKVENNNSNIPQKDLNNICTLIELRAFEIISKWKEYFNTTEVKFYC